MKNTFRTLVLLCVAALTIGALGGCAKKKAPTPATPPPAPAAAPAPTPAPETPPPAPAPVETPKPPAVQEGDFQPAFFDFDASTLRDDARAALDNDAKLLRQDPMLKIVIEGHCDERGTVEYNQALGERRANSAKDYLVAQGIDAGRMTVISYGKERPFAEGHDESAWQQNRRAHFRVAQ
jgi:peptidoglycan-associated lipoprotein